jgi:hypothetical protein
MDNNISKVKPSFLMLMKLKISEKLMAAEDSSSKFCSGMTSKCWWTREIDFGAMLSAKDNLGAKLKGMTL